MNSKTSLSKSQKDSLTRISASLKKNALKSESKKPADLESCTECGGYGWIIKDDRAFPCDCPGRLNQAVQNRIRIAGIPPRFLSKTLATFEAKDLARRQIKDAARSYAMSFTPEHGGLIMRGGVGSGKTHVAVAILKEVLGKGYFGVFWNFNDLLSHLRASYNRDAVESEDRVLAPLDRADLLVLDDLGTESVSDWVRDRLYLIINRRYESGAPTIITTNCEEAELEARVGPRIVSRLCEMCSDPFPPFPDQDWRRAMMR